MSLVPRVESFEVARHNLASNNEMHNVFIAVVNVFGVRRIRSGDYKYTRESTLWQQEEGRSGSQDPRLLPTKPSARPCIAPLYAAVYA